MKNIQIKFELNKELDKKMCLKFLKVKAGGVDFADGIIQVHPELEMIGKIRKNSDKEKRISEYFDRFYEEYQSMLDKDLSVIEEKWSKIQDKFFLEIQKIFGDYKWPKGKYIGYVSTINCNVVFWEEKTWQVFAFLPDQYNAINVHELLHFIFLDYFEKHVSDKKLKANWWMISEVFNDVILNMPEFEEMIKPGKELGYPEHKEVFERMKKEWSNSKNIDEWLAKF